MNEVIHGDCLEVLPTIPDKSINLVCVDLPYNIGKAYKNDLEWDKWNTVEEYIDWVGKGFLEVKRVLKDNGSFYWFHNDFQFVSLIQNWIIKNTDFEFKQLIIWNKRFEGCKNKGFLDGFVVEDRNRNYHKMVEYILYYVNTNQFDNPFVKIIKDKMKELNLTQNDISKINPSKNGKLTGWLSNILNNHYLPTEEIWGKLVNLFGINNEYDKLKYSYKELVYTFNNQKKHHSVWNYDINSKENHPTEKPIELIENIILHSSNENDLVLDYTAGSGTTAIACINTNRNYICIEKDRNFFDIINKRIEKTKNNLFKY